MGRTNSFGILLPDGVEKQASKSGRILSSIWISFALCFTNPASMLAQMDSSGYAPVNGLQMYYEIHGDAPAGGKSGIPLVLIHGGGSTIETTFGRILPALSRGRRVIAVELQGHGHTADIDRPFSFEQDADDVTDLLHYLKIDSADFFGFSNGGQVALQIGIRHPEIVQKLIIASAMFRRDGLYPQFWESMKQASLENMPALLKKAYLKVAPVPTDLPVMFAKDKNRMLNFKDWPPESIQSIKSPTMIMIGDEDVVRPEHAVEMFRLLPHARLVILPGGHGEYIGEATFPDNDTSISDLAVRVIEEFLDKPIAQFK